MSTPNAVCRHDGGAVTHGRALCARRGAEDGRLARGGNRPLCGCGPVRRRHAIAPRGRGGGVCGLYHGQERVRLRRDGAVGAGRVGRADGGWLLPAFRSVPRQCEDGAGARLEKAHRYRKFPTRLHGVSCGHGPAGGGAGPRSCHMLGYGAIGNTMGSVRKLIAKKSKKCLTFGRLFDRIAEPLETGRQTTKDFEKN